jgi:hypothetical protein
MENTFSEKQKTRKKHSWPVIVAKALEKELEFLLCKWKRNWNLYYANVSIAIENLRCSIRGISSSGFSQ